MSDTDIIVMMVPNELHLLDLLIYDQGTPHDIASWERIKETLEPLTSKTLEA